MTRTIQPFSTNPNRDAYAAIRGFVYQVNLTIQRWLQLRSDETLELEAGEDIDIVRDALNQDPFPIDRLLDQIKHREVTITLRSKEALEAISNAIEHRETNPGHKIKFCFTTNAEIGREKKRPRGTPPRTGLLTLWDGLQKNRQLDVSLDVARQLIRSFVTSLSRPDNFDNDHWASLQKYFEESSDQALSDFISNFEWMTGKAEHLELRPAIEASLLSSGKATISIQARQQYEQLFAYVFFVLSTPGRKSLTVAQLEAQLAIPTLSDNDRQIIYRVQSAFHTLEIRVGTLEQLLGSIDHTVSELAARESIVAYISPEFDPPLDPPPLPIPLVSRHQTVVGICAQWGSKPWLSITGSVDIGKSTLGQLIAQSTGELIGWISLNDSRDEVAVDLLERSLGALGGGTLSANRGASLQLVLASHRGEVLVIDGLPDLAVCPELSQVMLSLAVACARSGVRLMTIGLHQLPQSATNHVGGNTVCTLEAPLLNSSEVTDYLSARGCPSSALTPAAAGFVQLVTRGHPTLLGAAANYLESRGWAFDEAALTELIGGAHSEPLEDEILRRLIHVLSQRSRDVLFRVSLYRRSFSSREVDAVAVVQPTVERRREAIVELTGPWLRRLDGDYFEVSPLVLSLADNALDSEVKLKCHEAIGDSIVTRNRISDREAVEAIHHFVSADKLNRAAVLFLCALRSYHKSVIPVSGEPLVSLWLNAPMPSSMDSVIRLLCRAYQIMVRADLGKDLSAELIDDFRSLLDQAQSTEPTALVTAALLGSMGLARINPSLSQELVKRAIDNFDRATGPDGRPLIVPSELRPERLLFGCIPALRSDEDFNEWVDTIECLSAGSRATLFNDNDGALSCLVFAGQIIARELEKRPDERDWNAVLLRLRAISDRSSSFEVEVLEAAAKRAQIRVQFEFLQDQHAARAIADEIENFRDFRAKYLVLSEFARQLAYRSQNPETAAWIQNAFDVEPTDFPNEPIFLRIAAAQAFSSNNTQLAEQHAGDALTRARNEPTFPRVQLAAIAASYALTVYSNEGLTPKLFEAWQEAAKLLFDSQYNSAEWKCLVLSFSNSTKRVLAAVHGERAANVDPEGNPLVEPEVKYFFINGDTQAAYFDSSKLPLLAFGLGEIAVNFKKWEIADEWYNFVRLNDEGSPTSEFGALSTLMLSVYLIHQRDWGFAFRERKRALEAIIAASTQGPSQVSSQTENTIVLQVVLPSIVSILSIRIDDSDSARSEAVKLATACRDYQQEFSGSTLWSDIADILELSSREAATYVEVRDVGRDSRKNEFARYAARLCAAHLGSPVEALFEHLGTIPNLSQQLNGRDAPVERILSPYLAKFWTNRLTTQAFLFRNLNSVKALLANACETVEPNTPARILSAINHGFVISGIPDGVQQWLRT